jgi:uncharacterized protein
MSAQLLVLAKSPRPGRSKTRLCPPCTPEQAAELAGAALADTLDAVRRSDVDRRALALDGLLTGVPPGIAVVAQRGDGLGERIAAGFADAAADGPATILQIGMDTPQATAELLDRCVAALCRPGTDAVLGLAEDGGWWALGLRDPARARLVVDVPMSTADTGRLTLAALRSAGLRVALLPPLRDVDRWADAVAVAALAPGTRFAAAVRLSAGPRHRRRAPTVSSVGARRLPRRTLPSRRRA